MIVEPPGKTSGHMTERRDVAPGLGLSWFSAPATSWVVFGNVSRDGLGAWPGVALEGADRSMSRARQQDGRVDPVLGGMRQR
jgi:hypothetical protein